MTSTDQAPTAGSGVTGEELLALYERVAAIRRTERAAQDLFQAGLVMGTTHLAAGHEAVTVGTAAALRDNDYVFATYRGHHHVIAHGASPASCLAELMSRATGLCGATCGSMHLTKADAGMLGSYARVERFVADVPRGGGGGHRPGDAPRRERRLPRRGHRRRGGRVHDGRGTVRRVRPATGLGHAGLRTGHRRRGDGCDDRAAAGRTSRLVIVEENPYPYQGGWGATVAAIVADEGFETLDSPVRRVAAACVPLPFADALEDEVIPSVAKLAEEIRRIAAY